MTASASAGARALRPTILGVLMASLTACSAGTATPGPASPSPMPAVTPSASPSVAESPAPSSTLASGDVILATTTSTQDSGLLDVLVPAFETATGYTVKTIAVGSGQAMEMGENGDADVLLVHSPAAERDFVDAGYGIDRRLVMHNWFLVVGPPSDPAGIKGMTSVTDAFTRIAGTESTFVSRGDGSGTETRELKIWKAAGIEPAGDWYLQSGQGMAATLRIASEKAGYTLTDDATWFTTEDVLDLEAVVEEDAALINPYHVIEVNPVKRPKVNAPGAAAFADFLLSDEGQAIIGDFGLAEYGRQLFVPDAGKTEAELGRP